MLDIAKFLALIPHDWKSSFITNASIEELSFEVKLEVDPNPVSFSWLTHFLGLKNTISEKPSLLKLNKKKHTLLDLVSQEGNVRVGDVDKNQLCHVRKPIHYHTHQPSLKEGIGNIDKVGSNVNGFLPKSKKFQNLVVGRDLSDVEKGKSSRARKQKPKELSLYYQNAKLIIEKKRGQVSKKVHGPLELGLGETMMGSSSDSRDGDRSPLDKGLKMGYGKVIHKEISGQISIHESGQVSKPNLIPEEDVACAGILPKTPKKIKGGKTCLSSKCQGMRTRNSKLSKPRPEQVMDRFSN
ncbi:hypothetical protein Q3G72_018700 [Acer saccharum]|nr:hypothetical protein Q3G72_018700 [Acer saccharum]